MAAGKINLQKASGGVTVITGVDGIGNTELLLPESGELVNKDYADLKVALTSFIGTNQNLTQNGYQKLPGGLIIQWGVVANNNSLGSGFNTLVFPISFPNECFSIAKMNVAASGGGYNTSDASFVSGGLTASGASWIAYGSNNSIATTPGTVGINYIAIGR